MHAGDFWFGPGRDLITFHVYEINSYMNRQFGLPNPHREGSQFWSTLPFDIPDFCLNICQTLRMLSAKNPEKQCICMSLYCYRYQ